MECNHTKLFSHMRFEKSYLSYESNERLWAAKDNCVRSLLWFPDSKVFCVSFLWYKNVLKVTKINSVLH